MKKMDNTSPLIHRLPSVRGRLTTDAPLAPVTWFGVGGPAEVLFKPADMDDLIFFLRERPTSVPVMTFGVGSNLLIRDGGIPGVVIRLGRRFATITTEGTGIVAGAAALDLNVALAAKMATIGGLEFLSGIPGTIGGALRMNAGAYGFDIADVLEWVETVDLQGKLHRFSRTEMGLSYRHCSLPDDHIFLRARLVGKEGEPDEIAHRIDTIRSERETTQPVRARTGGSTFANPPGHKAWQLIDAAGCRGLQYGGAMVSEKHCNFLINTGTASAADIETLGEDVRRRVFNTSGIMLEWEIRRIGVMAQAGDSERKSS